MHSDRDEVYIVSWTHVVYPSTCTHIDQCEVGGQISVHLWGSLSMLATLAIVAATRLIYISQPVNTRSAVECV